MKATLLILGRDAAPGTPPSHTITILTAQITVGEQSPEGERRGVDHSRARETGVVSGRSGVKPFQANPHHHHSLPEAPHSPPIPAPYAFLPCGIMGVSDVRCRGDSFEENYVLLITHFLSTAIVARLFPSHA